MSKLIIGFTGSFGSGCTSSAENLGKKGYDYISFSIDILLPLSIKYEKPFETREDKQIFGNYIRKTHKKKYRDTLFNIINQKGNNIVIECFRNPLEIDFLREEFPHFYLIAFYSPQSLRDSRTNEPNFPELDKRDAGEEDKLGQQVRRCVNNADIVIDNSIRWGTIDDANKFFDELVSYIDVLKEPYRPPTDKEMIMHLAYSVSLRSKCIQRQVGAVITDNNFKVLSTGYNDVPHDSDSCFELFNNCYRKIKKKNVLEESINKINYCPICGEQLKNIQEKLFQNTLNDYWVKCDKCDTILDDIISPGKELDFCRSLHAEENAILSNPYLSESMVNGKRNLIMFSTTFPCMLCAKKIANSGISRLIFVEPYPMRESKTILNDNNVTIEAFQGIKSLKFNWIFRKRGKHIKEKAFKQLQQLNDLTKGG